jgi:CHAT domain-containing protein/tetratricopeptide (TPR) repeat protein
MLLIWLAFICCPVYSQQSSSLDQKIAQGQAAFDRNDYTAAIAIWEPTLDQVRKTGEKQHLADLIFKIGLANYYRKNAAKALDAFQQALTIYRDIRNRFGEASALGNIGVVEKEFGRYDAALSSSQQALAIHREVTERIGEANDLANIGSIEENLEHYDNALGYYQQALVLHRALKDRLREASDLTDIGNMERTLNRYDDALRSLGQALAINREIKNRLGEADDLMNIGNVEADVAHYEDALRSYQQALPIAREIKYRLGEAGTLNGIGNVEGTLGRYDNALNSHEQALAIHRELGDRRGEGFALGGIGDDESALGRYEDAISSYRQALTIAREFKYRLGEAHYLVSIGAKEQDLGRYYDALSSCQQGLAIARAVKYRRGEADALRIIGSVETVLLRYDDALSSLRQALAIDREIKNRLGEASDLGIIGAIEMDLGRYADARRSHQQAVAIHREIKNRLGEAADFNNMGLVELALGRNDDALRSYQQALATYREIKNRSGEAVALANIGLVENALGRYDDALRFARDSIALDRQLPNPDGFWKAFYITAFAEAHLNRHDAALANYDAALAQIEALRAQLNERERLSFFSNKFLVYDAYSAYLRELDRQYPSKGYDRKALEVLERKKARAVLEEIAGSAAQRFQGVPPDVIAQEKATQAAVQTAEQRLAKLYGSTSPSVAAAQSALDVATAQRTTFEKALQTKYPAYYALLHPKPITVGELQHVLRSDEALLAYDVLADKSVLFVVTRDNLAMVPLQGSTALTQAVARARAHIDGMVANLASTTTSPAKLERDSAADLPKFATDSSALYQQLIPAAVAPLIARKRLIIVPSGPLYNISWEALVTQTPATAPHYLLEDHAISYIPSGSLLALVRKTNSSRHRRAPLLAFANPAFGDTAAGGEARGGKYADLLYSALRAASGGRFPDLPGTAIEARGVRDALHAPAGSIITREDATKARLFSLNASHQLATYRYLLFATHAVLTHEVTGVDQPALVLAHPDRDGFVTMADVFGLSLDADFIALSACSTGQGAENPGEGISGLTRAFIYAGTPAISVTLWEVDDNVAPQITPPFFAAMSAGASPAQGLRRAKLAMLKSSQARFRHPYAWAPSVIFGDGDSARR